jgi:diaminopimelate epimerase
MGVPFLKMHGLGNDFVILDTRARAFTLPPAAAAAIADRRQGIGCDQVILLSPAEGADIFMRIRNPDGSEAGACGNATRCVAALMAAETGRAHVTIRTIAGDLPAEQMSDGRFCVDMGAPRLDWQDLPLAAPHDTLHLPLLAPGVADPAACSMGNPHATFFVPNVAALDIPAIGPGLEHDPIFPERANIGFVECQNDGLRLRMWERGAGETRACGSGACAALVNAHRRGLIGRAAPVWLDGGRLDIAWRETDGHVLMTGPVTTVFHGQIDLPQ